MIRLLLHLFFLLLLFTLQVSFIHALPYPFDHTPLVLVVTVYLYQYHNYTSIWWWLIAYGFLLDLFVISVAPLEGISYALATITMVHLVAHIFTNRSFYGMAATALLSLFVLLISQLSFIVASHVLALSSFSWQDVVFSQLWGMAFAGFFLLFIFPLVSRVWLFIQRMTFDH